MPTRPARGRSVRTPDGDADAVAVVMANNASKNTTVHQDQD